MSRQEKQGSSLLHNEHLKHCLTVELKCDGHVPCARCRAEDGICVFGTRKVRAKTYPKGQVFTTPTVKVPG